VYCKGCGMAAHWGCIGEKTVLWQTSLKKKTYYFFQCDLCRDGQNPEETVRNS